MSVIEDDEDTEYIDFDTMTDEEMEKFYKWKIVLCCLILVDMLYLRI
jgi:hypothetical protein